MTSTPAAFAQAAEATSAPAARKEAAGIVKRSSAFYADPRTITPKLKADGARLNKRFDFGDLEELAASIKANGLLMPLRVKRIAPTVIDDGKGPEGAQVKNFELIDGERRLTAIMSILKKDPLAFAEGVLVVIVDKDQDDVTSLIQMYVANGAKNFTPIEEAHAFKDMKDSGMTIKQICAATGKAHMHVTEIMALLDGDESLVKAATDGTIGKTMAKTIARFGKDKKVQAELTKAAVEAGKDKGKLNKVKAAIQDARAKKAEKKGRVLKIRALSDAELSEMGKKLAEGMAEKLKDAGKPLEFDMAAWIAKDEALALAASFGALQALKAAAGMKAISLDF
jgi:ParB/RepB/Spo0J family partition protein